MGKLKVGIVGRRGAAFYAGLRAIEDVELVGLCDLNQDWLQREAELHSIPQAFRKYEDLLNEVDAVVVATPMQLHAAQAIVALQAGKHVMSEVTACVSLEECWRLLDAERNSGAAYFMAENYCYLRDNVLIGELVKRGFFGDLYYGEGEYLHDAKSLHHFPDGSPTWRYYWQVGVPGSTYPTHSLGPVMQWFTAADSEERIESVICVGSGRHTDPEHPHDDTSLLLVRLASGKLVRVRLDMMSNRPHHMAYYALQGTKGCYESSRLSHERGNVWFGANPDPGATSVEDRVWRPIGEFDTYLPEQWKNPSAVALTAGHGGGDYWVVQDFVDAALGKQEPKIGIFEALEWTAAGLCSQTSIANGGVSVRVPDFRDPAQRPILLDAPPVVI